jgi:hypothetical protein
MMNMGHDLEEGFRILLAVQGITKTLCNHAESGDVEKVEELLQERERLLGRLPEFLGPVRPGEGRPQNLGPHSGRFTVLVEAITRENEGLMKLLHERKSHILERMREIRLGRYLVNYSREATL